MRFNMVDLLDRAKSFLGWSSDPPQSETAALIDVVADNYSPKIRLVRNYKDRLKEPVQTAANYIQGLIDQIPVPIDVTTPEMCDKQLIRPFFNDRKEYEEALREDANLNEFLKSSHSDIFYTLLTMASRPKIFYGSQMQGEICVRNIALKAMNVSDHRFRVPSESAEQACYRYKVRLLQNLTRQALEITSAKKAQVAELEQMREELCVKVDIFAEDKRACEETQALLDQVECELQDCDMTSEYYLDYICDFLRHADQHLSAKPLGMKLDRMNILIADKAANNSDQIRATKFRLDEDHSRIVVLLKCHRNVLMA